MAELLDQTCLDPNQPATGSMEEKFDRAINAQIAAALASYRAIYVAYPRHTAFHSKCDYVLRLGQSTRGQPQVGFRVLAPSGSGKTAAAEAFIRIVEREFPRTENFVPVVIIGLEKMTTSKKLMMSILHYFGDKYSTRGNELSLKRRVQACFERFGTMLLIIDEVQHLNLRTSQHDDATDSLKRFLDDGMVPIAFLGTEDAAGLFTRNRQLSGRLLSPCDFLPLSRDCPGDGKLLTGFVSALDRAIADHGLLPRRGELYHPWIRGCLLEVSDGVIGRISRLVGIALEIALRRGAECIEVYDLALATDRWAVPLGFIAHNPFRRRA